jgi:uncharacterized membrane protein
MDDDRIKRVDAKTGTNTLLQWAGTVFVSLAITAIVIGASIGWQWDRYLQFVGDLNIQLKAPQWGYVNAAPVIIQLHLYAALTALAIGIVLLSNVKGTTMHRALGWGWVVAMAVTAISSVFIREINGGAFSFIHLLTGWTIIVLPMAVFMAKRHNVNAHSRMMTGLFTGGLIIAGLFTFMPGRLMFRVFLQG